MQGENEAIKENVSWKWRRWKIIVASWPCFIYMKIHAVPILPLFSALLFALTAEREGANGEETWPTAIIAPSTLQKSNQGNVFCSQIFCPYNTFLSVGGLDNFSLKKTALVTIKSEGASKHLQFSAKQFCPLAFLSFFFSLLKWIAQIHQCCPSSRIEWAGGAANS